MSIHLSNFYLRQGPIVEHIYNSLLSLYGKYNDSGLKGRILQCLGVFLRSVCD